MDVKAKIAIALAVGLFFGYFIGREHLKHQMTSAFTDAMGGMARALSGNGDAKSLQSVKSVEAAENASEYATKLKIYDWTAKYHSSLTDGRIPGVTFKIKNEGDKTVSELKVVVYFQDAEGNTIAEEEFYPILDGTFSVSRNNGPLKPGYVWQQEPNRFFAAKQVPSEWKEGATTVAIAEVKFE
ncbi:hypothetical protein [Dokdonella sp.]|uniref:hypothetical protein n=1 Tax=Dokdonella sp. TaxID=2291710 RepID=UPI003526FCB6